MKKFLLIFLTCLFCVSCGVKGDPEYQSKNKYNKTIQLI
jgi:hypothetical protein